MSLVRQSGLSRALSVVDAVGSGSSEIADGVYRRVRRETDSIIARPIFRRGDTSVKRQASKDGSIDRGIELSRTISASSFAAPSLAARDVQEPWWALNDPSTPDIPTVPSAPSATSSAPVSSTSVTQSAPSATSVSPSPSPASVLNTQISTGGIVAAVIIGSAAVLSIAFLGYLLYLKIRRRRESELQAKNVDRRFSGSCDGSGKEKKPLVWGTAPSGAIRTPSLLQGRNGLRSHPTTSPEIAESSRGPFSEPGEVYTRIPIPSGHTGFRRASRSRWPIRRSYTPSPLNSSPISTVSEEGTSLMIKNSLSPSPGPFIIDHPLVDGRDMAQISPGVSPNYPYPLSPSHVGKRSISLIDKPLPAHPRERSRSFA
ncbi:hypothetical protein MMC06_006776 [Schaereria dolodes]|nr:hypothetical protein [Schaereria dolodes]